MPYSWLSDAQLEVREAELREAAHNAPKEIGRSCGAYAQRAYDWTVARDELARRRSKVRLTVAAYWAAFAERSEFKGFGVDDEFCDTCGGVCQHPDIHSESFIGKCTICGKPLGPPGAPDLDPTRCYSSHGDPREHINGLTPPTFSNVGGKIVITPKYTEENCPGHVASKINPKICERCGVHIDSLRPPEDV